MYAVYRIVTRGAPQNHHSIFVLISPLSGNGYIYQVSGDIQTGMHFNHRTSSTPSDEPDFLSSECIGYVKEGDFRSQRMKEVVESIEPPSKQFEGAKCLVGEEDVRTCQEWVKDVVEVLKEKAILGNWISAADFWFNAGH